MNVLINLTLMLGLMLGLILAVMMVPLLFWRGLRARPGTTLLITLLVLFALIGAAMQFDRLFPGCRISNPAGLPRYGHYCGP